MLLAEDVLPHPFQGHRWEPSASWPFLMREVESHRGQHVGRGEFARHRRLRGANELPLLPEGGPSISWSIISSTPSPGC